MPQNHIPPIMFEQAQMLFEERRVVSRTDLDIELEKYAADINPDEFIGSGRNTRKNLMDHVKRDFTQNHLTFKLQIGGEVYYCWWPTIGAIAYHGNLMQESEARLTLDAIKTLLS